MEDSFYGCANLTIETGAGQPNLSSVTSTKGMFRDADSINQPIGDWGVSGVTDMSGMFRSATSFNLAAWRLECHQCHQYVSLCSAPRPHSISRLATGMLVALSI